MKELDKVDLQILNLLQEDARITNKELAAKLGLSTTPVFERVKKLEKRGYIKGYVALVDPTKLNKSLTAFTSVSLSKHTDDQIREFMDRVSAMREVLECFHIAGQTDYLMKIVVKDMEEYQKFILEKLSTIDSIAQVRSSFVMSTVKHTTAYELMAN